MADQEPKQDRQLDERENRQLHVAECEQADVEPAKVGEEKAECVHCRAEADVCLLHEFIAQHAQMPLS